MTEGGDSARVTVTVAVPPEVAFEVFTQEIDLWWRRGPKFRPMGRKPGVLHFEGKVGGRLFESFETSTGAKVHQTGKITAWEPPSRFAFEWRSPNYVAEEKTFVEVLFEESASGTLVTVTHSGWSALRPDHPARHGEQAGVFLRRMGLWWGDQMTSLRLHLEHVP